MIPAGERTTVVTFEHGTSATDDYGGETLTWASRSAEAWAKVLYGTGQERRQAAQESADQAATVMVNWTPTLGGVVPKDRATFDGFAWDITAPPARVGLNDELHFTVVRSA
jgi:SPP1 family predicted phage head-tail adaptor